MAMQKTMNVSISEDANEEINVMISEEPYVPYKMTDKLYKDLDNAHKALLKKKITPYQLKVFISKHPHVPTFYNYLSVCYQDNNEPEKVLPVIKTLIKKFPYYFHAQLNLIAHYLETDDNAASDAYFENVKSIQDVAPKKEAFHTTEFVGFYSAFMEYLAVKPSITAISKMERIISMLEKTSSYFPTIKAEIPNLQNLIERTKILKSLEEKAKNEDTHIIHLKMKDEE